ncbi:MAG: hypothetical protein EBR79_00905 [Proteobacteria bacterium]|nr:hypothetical protein [Pseudomonadota bacterium]NBX86129.1 hypothetical protein [Pseudomonadota bacterium]
MPHLTNAHKFFIVVALVAICTGAMLYKLISLTTISSNASSQLKEIALITQRHMESDMMHDAIRGDVLAAIMVTKAPEMVDAAQVEADYNEHIANFKENANNNFNSPALSPEIREKYTALMADITAYGQSAEATIGMAKAGQNITKADWDTFMQAFSMLEESMGAMSDSIGVWATNTETHINQQLDAAARIATLLAMMSLLMTAALPILVFRQVFRPQARVLKLFESEILTAVTKFDDSATNVSRMADNLTHKINTSSQNATTVATAAQNTSQNSNTVAAAAEEIQSSLTGVASQVNQANQVVNEAVGELERAKAISNRLNEATTHVKQIIGLIGEVASKINLLSLNASIEAARAGDAGKGFAVVAQEVKSLAGQTQSSSQEIIKQINEVSAVSEEVVGVIDFFQKSITSIQQNMVTINGAVSEQEIATKQITQEIFENANRNKEILSVSDVILNSTQTALTESGTVKDVAESVAVSARTMTGQLQSAIRTMRLSM